MKTNALFQKMSSLYILPLFNLGTKFFWHTNEPSFMNWNYFRRVVALYTRKLCGLIILTNVPATSVQIFERQTEQEFRHELFPETLSE